MMEKIKSIENVDFSLAGKRVAVRVDFNVPVKKGKVMEDFRISKTLPTLKFLSGKKSKIILISHIGEDGARSLKPVAEYLKKYFTVNFHRGDIESAKKGIEKMKNGEILMLENIRVHKGEVKNSVAFAKKLSELGDVFVNDAFSVSHRKHTSIIGMPKYLPSYAGLLFWEELKNLGNALETKHPSLLILGGVKFGTKLGVLERFLKIADKIFVGGALANNFFKLKGVDIEKSVFDKNVSVKKYLNNKKIILPEDVVKKNGVILDAGTETIKTLSKFIKDAKSILWNGPLGNFEIKGFEKSTEKIARAIAESKAESIIGGGDTVAAVKKSGISLEKFSFVSTAGGAMLEFLAKGILPGIEALKKSKK